jgi:hypothetical protein
MRRAAPGRAEGDRGRALASDLAGGIGAAHAAHSNATPLAA